MIAKNRDRTERRIQSRQRSFQTRGSFLCTGGIMADDEVTGQHYQIRPCSVHLVDDPAQSSGVHCAVAEVNVRQERYLEARCVGRPIRQSEYQSPLYRAGDCFP